MKTVIYLHGFNSSGKSETVEKLRKALGPEFNLIAPSYNCHDPVETKKVLTALVNEYRTIDNADEFVIVGTSLGGFWAEYFARELGIHSVIINPSRAPFTGLSKYIGHNKNYSTGVEYEFTEEMLNGFLSIDLERKQVTWPMIALLYSGDTVVNAFDRYDEMKDFCSARLIKGGEHRLTDESIPTVVAAINEVINTIAG